MKRALIIAPIAVVGVTGLLLAAPSFVDWNQYKGQAQDQIKKATGYDVSLKGDLGLTLLPAPRIFIENVEIAAPAGSAADHLARVKRLDVNLSLMDLLGGRVDFSAIKLVEPDIALEVLADGRQNWMTPELEKMTAKSDQPAAKAPEISLQNVTIEKGAFTYKDSKTRVKPIAINDLDVTLGADSLQGPFEATGRFVYGDQEIKIHGKTVSKLVEGEPIAVSLNASSDPMGAMVKYAGVASLKAPYDIQGETEIRIESLSKLTDGAVAADEAVIKGLVTASQDKVDFKNAVLDLGGNQFSGDISATLSPMKVTGKLQAQKTVNADSLIQTKKGDKKAASGQILPQTIELPAAFEADLQLAAPGLVYNGQSYKNVSLKFAKAGGNFTAGFAAGEIPGAGNIDATADLKFASKSLSKTGAEIYSDPTLTGTVKGKTQNIAQTAEALSGMKIPALTSWKTGSIDGAFNVTSTYMELKDAHLQLDQDAATISAAFSPRGSRPALALDVAADTLDFDKLQQKMNGGQAPAQQSNLQDTIKAISIPYDVDFDIGVQNAVLQKQQVKGLRAQGQTRDNALKFTNLSAQDFAGSSFKLEGGIGNLKELKAIDVKFSGQSDDPKGVMKMAGLDPSTLPQNIESASVTASLAGDISKMAVKAGIKALNGEVIASGDVANPLAQMEISNMAVQVKHRNMAEALRIFAPSAPQYASWQKPMDFYADINTQGKVHTLKNIKADLAGASLVGNISYDQSGAKPAIKGDLQFGDLVMTSAPGAVPTGTGAPQTQSSGRWSSEPIDSAWMHAFNADLSIKAKSLVYETWNLQQPVLSFDLKDGKLDIRQLDSGLYGGKVALKGAMQAPPGGKGVVSVDGTAKFQDVSVENLAASLARGTRLIKGQGKVNMDTVLKTSGGSQQALVSNLSGNGTIDGENIVLEGFDLVRFGRAMSEENKPGETVLGLWKTSIKGGSTSFDTLDGNYTVTQGIVKINKLDMDGAAALLATTGSINIPQWTIATNHAITLKQNPDVPPFSIKISGSLNNPANTFGEGLIQDYLQRKLTRKLDKVIGDKLGGQNGLGGVLGQALGLPAPTPAPAPVPQQVAPAAGEAPAVQPQQQQAPVQQQQPVQQQEEITPEKAIEGVLKGLLSQ